MAPISFTETLRARVIEQTATTTSLLREIHRVYEWPHFSDGCERPPTMRDIEDSADFIAYYMVANETNVICDVWEEKDQFMIKYGAVSPNTLLVSAPETMRWRQSRRGMFDVGWHRDVSGLSVHSLNSFRGPVQMDTRPIAVDEKYAIVGLKLSCEGKVFRIRPIVATLDRHTGTTSWPGTKYQGLSKPASIWLATLPDMPLESVATPYLMNDRSTPPEGHSGLLRGFRMKGELSGYHAPTEVFVFKLGSVTTNWSTESWLPSTVSATEDVTYVPIEFARGQSTLRVV